MKIGSLCTGYGGLDIAVEAFFIAEMVWCAEIDKQASELIATRFNKPNLGDIKQIDWDTVEPIDILTAGYPCQPFSHAGQRKGIEDDRHIWPYIIKAISALRPKIVVLENVRGHLSLGFKEVLKDLAENGYDAKWQVIRASDVGAPHQRARLFIVAYPISIGQPSGITCRCEATLTCITHDGCAANTHCDTCTQSRRATSCIHVQGKRLRNGQDQGKTGNEYRFSLQMDRQTIPSTLDQDRLNVKFVEYMMGLNPGWVTDLPFSRAQQLRMLGNGVVPQQAYHALQLLCEVNHCPYSETI